MRVREERLILIERGFGPSKRLLGAGEGILGRGNAGTAFEVLSLGNVEVFLRN